MIPGCACVILLQIGYMEAFNINKNIFRLSASSPEIQKLKAKLLSKIRWPTSTNAKQTVLGGEKNV